MTYYEAFLACDYSEPGIIRIKRYGIGFGQKGYWGNEHFGTREQAEQAFEKHLQDCKDSYSRSWSGKYEIEEVPVGKPSQSLDLLRLVRIWPILKSGKRGKIVHTLHLYYMAYRDKQADEIRKHIPTAI